VVIATLLPSFAQPPPHLLDTNTPTLVEGRRYGRRHAGKLEAEVDESSAR